uniref:DB domain-containing protein n=1 Tax=Panagrellus redivivus TaxID=6233 RepID=A0A7E5A253_PANRE
MVTLDIANMFAITFLFLISAVLVVPTASLTSVTGEQLTEFTADDLRSLCPNDYKFCAEKIAEGRCFGNSKRAGELKRKCACSCNAAHHKRIQNCCSTVGRAEMQFCLPLCAYNTTLTELGGSLGLKCVSQLTTWAYCAADAQDNTACCRAKGVPEQCLSFCKGEAPTCDVQSIFSYKPCLKEMDKITTCQKENLAQQPQFDATWEAPCDWE